MANNPSQTCDWSQYTSAAKKSGEITFYIIILRHLKLPQIMLLIVRLPLSYLNPLKLLLMRAQEMARMTLSLFIRPLKLSVHGQLFHRAEMPLIILTSMVEVITRAQHGRKILITMRDLFQRPPCTVLKPISDPLFVHVFLRINALKLPLKSKLLTKLLLLEPSHSIDQKRLCL